MNIQFNGDRLREARIYRGITIIELSEALGLTKQMISKYENGKSKPNFETVSKLIMYLNFPKQFFYESDKLNMKVGNLYFRSLLSTSKREQERQQYPLKIISIIKVLLDEYIDFPVLDLPDMEKEEASKWDNPEVAAESLRNYWGLGEEPIDNMVELLESKGFIVSSFALNNTNIDAFGRRQKVQYGPETSENYLISLGDDSKVAVRRRFNAAHELAHFILHDPYVDSDEITKEQYKQMEKEAHEFAAAFLIPKNAFIRELSSHSTDIDNYIYLKRKWKLSISAMTVRAYRLKLINQIQYQSLQRKISSNKWRELEPLDKELINEYPVALKQAIELILDNNILTGDEIVKKLSEKYNLTLYPEEIERIIGLQKGTLSTAKLADNVVSLNLKTK